MRSVNPIELLGSAVDALSSEEPSGYALEEDVKELALCINRLQVVLAKRVRSLELFSAGGMSVTHLLRDSCSMFWSQARQTVAAGRVLSELPEIEAERMPYQNVCAISQVVEKIGLDKTREAASELRDGGLALHPGQFRQEARRVIYTVDQDGAFNDEKHARQRRWLDIYERYGHEGYGIEGMLDLESGQVLKAALAAFMKPSADDERSASQQRADALVELARTQRIGRVLLPNVSWGGGGEADGGAWAQAMNA